MFQIDQSGTSMGAANTIYVSIPASQTNCSDLGLPSLPDNWFYACSNSTNYRKVDGNGWIPVNFTSLSYRTPLEILPIDPINTTSTGNYYTYITGGSWELNAMFESSKYRYSGEKDRTSKDGGDFWAVYELGSNLTLSPFNDSGLVGYWKFDEGSGTTAGDSSGNGNTGTLTNGPTWTTGKVGSGALSFDKNNSQFVGNISNNLQQQGTNDFSILAWVNFKTIDTGGSFAGGGIVGTPTLDPSWLLGIDHNAVYCYTRDVTNGTLSAAYDVTGNLNLNTYYFLACIRKGSNLKSYLNGILKSTANGTPRNVNNSDFFRIGSAYMGYIDGLIDEVRIYNRALSAAEIRATYNATK